MALPYAPPPDPIGVVVNVVTRPSRPTVITGTALSAPYVPGVTPEADMVVLIGLPVTPVPVTLPVS